MENDAFPLCLLQGQNRITAGSRAFYFILVGIIALCINTALLEIDHFSPLCVYGFNVNNRSVLVFVRDGLFSEYVFACATIHCSYKC